jgi:hypothetical protein
MVRTGSIDIRDVHPIIWELGLELRTIAVVAIHALIKEYQRRLAIPARDIAADVSQDG